MSKNAFVRLLLLVVFSVTLSACSLRDSFRGVITPELSTTTDETTEIYTAVKEVREAQSDQEAVDVTTREVDAALEAADSAENTDTLNSTDVGL
jgi:hypothetical protein